MGRSRRKGRAGGAGFFGIPKKPKQSPVSRILVEDLPHLNRAEKKLRGLKRLAQTNPLAFKARFKDSRKRFVKLLEQTIRTVNTIEYETVFGKLHPEMLGLRAKLIQKLQGYEKQIAQEQLEETKRIIYSTRKYSTRKTRRKTT